ncbi:ABC transporter substrate-binding protein [uncultured Propionibacterium sp.]|uniref:ABC transporter substrate-binding protein n=1 Tax=uncultured Propionibacterium sp. TaxID=218066 RepID=UPI002931D5D6|nr:ABC transporter substrate-binding protein [uncultured Propionibacterium sp.]
MQIARRSLLAAGGLMALAACSSDDPTGSSSTSAQGPAAGSTVVVASQQYYSNEIIAELYAQALENAGRTVERQFQIGQREFYMPELESGALDLIPEYGGNLLQYYDKSSTASDAEAIARALVDALPSGLHVLAAAEASDQDSYTVTRASADRYALGSIGDLSKIGGTVTVAANSEFATRLYGTDGVKNIYGVDIDVLGVEDSGGPLTVKALTDGRAQAADIYTSDPAIDTNDLVVLEDPRNLILPQRVTPLASAKIGDADAAAIAEVNARLTSDELRGLNRQSTVEQRSSADIARDWLSAKGIVAA